MSKDYDTEMAELKAAAEERAKRKAEKKRERDLQRARDEAAIGDLEIEHDDCLAILEVPDSPAGMPVLVAARAPTPYEHKRYLARLKDKKDGAASKAVEAAEEVAASCRVYPDQETYAELLKKCPGVHVPLGAAALALVSARRVEEGKD